jgi:hypothetical protein
MSWLMVASAALLATLSSSPPRPSGINSCLPSDIKPSDVVSAQAAKPGIPGKIVTVTVAQKLRQLQARCRRGKLIDAGGKEIRFYRLIGCWGNPPDDYQEQLEHQAKELARLRRRYRVIEMTCNPSGQQIVQVRSF